MIHVTALSFDYGQKHRVELERAQSLVDYLNNKCHKSVTEVV
jgi:7-cyano-7-deazaguanine synthase in queuosine biosynthesis